MFETPAIRASFVDAIVNWIDKNYQLHDIVQLIGIRESLTKLSDEELYHAWEEVMEFQKSTEIATQNIERKVTTLKNTLAEEKEKTPAFNLFGF